MDEISDIIVLGDDGEMTVMGEDGRAKSFDPYLDRWLEGWPRRSQILRRVRPLLEETEKRMAIPGFDRAGGPALTLLKRGRAGIELDSEGSFPPAVLDDLESVDPDWAAGQTEVRLGQLYRVLARGSLMRRDGGRVMTCKSALPLLNDPDVVVRMSACWLVSGEGFNTDVAELGAALLLAGSNLDPDELAVRSHPAISEYWTQMGEPVTLDDVARAMRRWLESAEATGVVPDSWANDLRSEGDSWPRPIGPVSRSSLTTMLRYRTVRHIPRRPHSQRVLH